MRSGICPKCNGDDVRLAESDPFADSNRVPLGFFRYAILAHYICSHCGYHESYVSQEDSLQAVRDCASKVAVRSAVDDSAKP